MMALEQGLPGKRSVDNETLDLLFIRVGSVLKISILLGKAKLRTYIRNRIKILKKCNFQIRYVVHDREA